MNWADLESDVTEAAKAVFLDLQAAYPDEHFYAFALYTDSDGWTICPAANSEEGLVRKLVEDEIDADGEDAAYYRWATSEWVYEAWRGEGFDGICKRLREASGQGHRDFQARVFETMTNALATLRKDGVFRDKGASGPPILFVTLTDDERAEAVENASAAVLNDAAARARFAGRYGDEE